MKHLYHPILLLVTALLILGCAFSAKWQAPKDARNYRYEVQIQINEQWQTIYLGTNLTTGLQFRIRSLDTNGLTSEWVTR